MSEAVWATLVGGVTIVGTLLILFVAIRQLTTNDALGRINALGPASAAGIPLIAVGSFLGWTWQQGFDGVLLFKVFLTILAAMFISSVATSVLARAAYLSGAEIDPRTVPNDLAHEPTRSHGTPETLSSSDGEQPRE